MAKIKPGKCVQCGCDGIYCLSMCRPCYNRAYRVKNIDKIRERRRACYAQNPERILYRNRIWRASHTAITRESHATWCARNPEKVREYQMASKAKNPEKSRWATIKCTYGMSRGEFESMMSAQGGVCAICRKSPPSGKYLCIDHDHTTGEVRGLLCRKCNTGLGAFLDDSATIVKALEYLREATRNAKT